MNLDDQLRRYFGADDLAAIPPASLAAGLDRMLVDLGLETDRARQFALWTLMHMLGAAPISTSRSTMRRIAMPRGTSWTSPPASMTTEGGGGQPRNRVLNPAV